MQVPSAFRVRIIHATGATFELNRLEPNGEGNCEDVHGVVSTATNGDSSPALALEQGCGSRDSIFVFVERCYVPEAQNTWLLFTRRVSLLEPPHGFLRLLAESSCKSAENKRRSYERDLKVALDMRIVGEVIYSNRLSDVSQCHESCSVRHLRRPRCKIGCNFPAPRLLASKTPQLLVSGARSCQDNI